MNEQYKHLLEEAIQELPLKDRVIIRLQIAGETEENIGKVVKINQSNVSRRIRKITTELAAKCSNSDGAF